MKSKVLIIFILSIVLQGCNGCKEEKKSTETEKTSEETKSISENKDLAKLTSITEGEFPSYNPSFPPPANATRIFELSQDYPSKIENENYPWLKFDFRSNPNEYIDAVYQYCLEGNVDVDFEGQKNTVRKWYHAPWLHDDGRPNGNGREYIRGLTRERGTPKFEIHDNQDVELENWAVGMYNSPGGYTLGKIWRNGNNEPFVENSSFPEGTVSFKLLFTNGTVDKVPFLEGTLEWEANIYPCSPRKCGATERKNTTMRLLQIDVAVKDKRATETGWVFGTFMYDASHKGKNVWEKMVPVGLSWGDDPKVLSDMKKDGAFINKDLKETYLNPSLLKSQNQNNKKAYVKYHGLGGRLNGPVDNPISSCVSCHGQAGVNKKGEIIPMANFSLKRNTFTVDEFNLYFTNPKSGAYMRTFGNIDYYTTDYSLQVSAGIRNYYQNEIFKDALIAKVSHVGFSTFSVGDAMEVKTEIIQLPDVTRGEE